MKRIGIVGGGPAALFLYKRIIENSGAPVYVAIFEKKDRLGTGMPYSREGAGKEHVTNVSGNEIPQLVTSITDWINNCPPQLLHEFDMEPAMFNEFKVLPRLLFGEYLAAQFKLLQQAAKQAGIKTTMYYNTVVADIVYDAGSSETTVVTATGSKYEFDDVVICTGHCWPKHYEHSIRRWYDSPYPPAKLQQPVNFAVAIKGASLTAIDAIRTLARQNGTFSKQENGMYTYSVNKVSEGFSLALHSIKGLLPGIRFHLDDTHLSQGTALTPGQINSIKDTHNGFVPLDYIFEQHFKQPLREKNAAFFERIAGLNLEEFVEAMMAMREALDPFTLFKAEYREAEKSIRNQQSVYWKEMLAVLSYEMNYPAKHFSAEDMLRLKKVLLPLIAIVIAFVPQSSARELIALHEAGVLRVVPVEADSEVVPVPEGGCLYRYTDEAGEPRQTYYKMFINAVGQPAFMFSDFPFPSLATAAIISPAQLKFQSVESARAQIEQGNLNIVRLTPHDHYLQVPGININDHFQVVNKFGEVTASLYIMAVPYIAGLNPDYSGLDFCETASERIAQAMFIKDSSEHAAA
ncbi:MAG: hypothetical protein JWR61_1395 [Ferruginibacter sp.]|uniref:FAD/NAD(P)-binding protein n=1 Tax=Ferruginibacter sp. TaxID=1940288 RepID=UPI002657CC0C|nr:FAD/NAD(P)-binding protein [Ferruginibacter sp.]MDB5276440.1 hypothetical protein [Ferruginibacter sp.]